MEEHKPGTTQDAEEKIDFKRILPVIFIVFVDLMGLTILIPILPYYALSFNAPPVMIGLLVAAYPLMQFLGGPILGSLSDRYGRKPVLAVAQVGTFLSLLMLGFANALWVLFLARLLDGITGANLPTAQAAITDITTPRTRSQGFGLLGAAFGLGFIFGPAISGAALALSGNHYSAPAFVAAGFAFTSVMLTTFVFKETLPPEKRGQTQTRKSGVLAFGRMAEGLRNPLIGILFALIFMQQLVFGAFQSMFSPFTLVRLGMNSLGNTLFFVYLGLIIAFVQGGLIGKLTRRFGERRLVYTGLGLVASGLLLMSFTPTQPVPWYERDALIEELQSQTGGEVEISQVNLLPPEDNRGVVGLVYLMLVMTPISVGSSFLQPSINSLITQRVNPRDIGGALGLSAAFLSLANVVGPLWGGAAFDYITPYAPFLIGGIVSSALMLLAFQRVKPVSHAPQTAAAPGD
jgi:MFS transporter, DHA1 family, tetracycline resistance protein